MDRQPAEGAGWGSDWAHAAHLAAHELRSHLQIIIGFAALVDKIYGPALDEQGRDMVRLISASAAGQDVLINDLVALAELMSDHGETASIDLDLVMADVVAALGDGIIASGASVTWHGLPVVTGRRGHFVTLLQHLVDNAVKFVDSTTVPAVQVSSTRCDDHWLLTVADNGIGIDPAKRDDVFGPFTRLHPRQRFPGSGLGLTACRYIVSRLGGRIWVEGRPGGGSVFCVTLPAGRP